MTRRHRAAGIAVVTSPPPRRRSHHRTSHAVCSDGAPQYASQGVSATSNWEPGNRIAFVYISCTCTGTQRTAAACTWLWHITSVHNQWRADRGIVTIILVLAWTRPKSLRKHVDLYRVPSSSARLHSLVVQGEWGWYESNKVSSWRPMSCYCNVLPTGVWIRFPDISIGDAVMQIMRFTP